MHLTDRLAQFTALIFLGSLLFSSQAAPAPDAFVQVSPQDPRYFELSDGQPYIPIGLNLIAPNTREEDGLKRMDEWMQKLATNGGNYIRVWVSSPFWDVEHAKSGVYDEAKAKRIDAMLDMARRYGIRVKMTLEHFRSIDGPRRSVGRTNRSTSSPKAAPPPTSPISSPARPAASSSSASSPGMPSATATIRPSTAGNSGTKSTPSPAAITWPGPKSCCRNSTACSPATSPCKASAATTPPASAPLYRRHSCMPGNDVAQVHRYLDLGASLEVCHGPVDMLAADAVREIAACNPKRPIILAESGAVEPSTAAPSSSTPRTRKACSSTMSSSRPFFAGAAGPGQIWHWDTYVDRNNLWWHFARFAAAVKDIDPRSKISSPIEIKHPQLPRLRLERHAATSSSGAATPRPPGKPNWSRTSPPPNSRTSSSI